MKRYLAAAALWAVFLFGAQEMYASNSSVTATVTDTDGQVWTNGTWTAQILMPGGQFNQQPPTVGGVPVPRTAKGVMDSNGVLSGTLTDTSSLDQTGVQWQFSICPNASVAPYALTGCYALTTPIVGGSVSLTPKLNAVTAPRFPAGQQAFGYSDAEVLPVSVAGLTYFNTSTNLALAGMRLWDGQRWVAGGGGGGSTGLTGSYNFTNQIASLLNGSVISVGAPFSFTFSCPGAGNYETGYSLVNPSCSYTSYSGGTVASATLSDGANTVNLTSPYSTATLSHTYTTNTTFTGAATATNSQSALYTQGFAVYPCSFYGLSSGSSPAGVTASGSGAGNQCASETATLAGGLGVLQSNGLTSSNVGQTFNFSSPGGLYAVLFLLETAAGCNHTSFIFNGSSPVNPVSTQAITNYSNILGGVVPHSCLYLFGPYSAPATLKVNN